MSTANAVSDETLILNYTPILFHQEIYIRHANFEFGKLEPIESVDPAQAATATLHKDWLDTKRRKALQKYHKQGEPRNSDRQADLIQIFQI